MFSFYYGFLYANIVALLCVNSNYSRNKLTNCYYSIKVINVHFFCEYIFTGVGLCLSVYQCVCVLDMCGLHQSLKFDFS